MAEPQQAVEALAFNSWIKGVRIILKREVTYFKLVLMEKYGKAFLTRNMMIRRKAEWQKDDLTLTMSLASYRLEWDQDNPDSEEDGSIMLIIKGRTSSGRKKYFGGQIPIETAKAGFFILSFDSYLFLSYDFWSSALNHLTCFCFKYPIMRSEI